MPGRGAGCSQPCTRSASLRGSGWPDKRFRTQPVLAPCDFRVSPESAGMPRSAQMLYQCSDVKRRIREEENVGITYVEFEDEAGTLRRYRKHVNGRGLVATTAKVDPTAFVDPTAYVDPGAEVQRGAQIGPGGWVDRDAIVAERAVIGVNAHVGPRAVVGRNAVVGPYATIGANARVQNGARVPRELIDRRRRRVPCLWRRPAPPRPRGLSRDDYGCPGQLPGAFPCRRRHYAVLRGLIPSAVRANGAPGDRRRRRVSARRDRATEPSCSPRRGPFEVAWRRSIRVQGRA